MGTYLAQLKSLLAGETAEIDDKPCQIIHHPDLAVARPIKVPLLLSAFGPKGIGVATELEADGIMNMFLPAEGFGERVQMVSGTVLDEGEVINDSRPAAVIGPWHMVAYHGIYQAVTRLGSGAVNGWAWNVGRMAQSL